MYLVVIPEGRHGLGAAKIARQQFGAVYGQGEGLQGNAYALPTKNIRKVTTPKGTINVYWVKLNQKPLQKYFLI